MTRPSPEELCLRIQTQLQGARCEVLDESHLHAGHVGAEGGAGHYKVRVSAPQFAGLRTIARHRLVYDAVQDWMPHRVHALSIEILAD